MASPAPTAPAPAPAPAPASPPPLAALGLMVVAMTLVPLGDSAARVLTAGMAGLQPVGSGFVAWSRFFLAAAALYLLMPAPLRAEARALLADRRIWLRGALLVGGIWAVLTALALEEMATVYGAFFIGPILSAVLAVALLGERVGRAQAVFLVLGFGGVLLVVRPGWGPEVLGAGVAFGLLSGLCYGGFLTASRWLSARARALPLLWSQFAVGAVLLTPVGLAQWPDSLGGIAGGLPDGRVALLALASAAASLAGNLLLLLAYRRAPASQLAPVVYAQLVMATAMGWALFGEWPDAWVLAGLGLLVASGLAGYLTAPRQGR